MNTSRPRNPLSSFTVASLWHRRLARTQLSTVRVQPRVAAELILHPVISKRLPAAASFAGPRGSLDGFHAA
jgi:hypothetical protein